MSRTCSSVVCIFGLFASPAGVGAQAAPTSVTALVGGTLYVDPGAEPISSSVVIISGGRIRTVGSTVSTPVPDEAEVIDCSGFVITAGFWNSHVHFLERKWSNARDAPERDLASQMQAMLTRFGYTTVVDTGSELENTLALRARIESGELPGPRIFTTGPTLVPPGGAAAELILDVKGFMRVAQPEVSGARAAAAVSRALLDAGADAVKMYVATWAPPILTMPSDAIRSVVEEARRRAKWSFAHPSNRDGLAAATSAGVDVILHTTPQSGPWDDEILSMMRGADVALVPTLKLWGYELRHDRDSARDRFVEVGVEQLRAWHHRGGAVLFGTDVGYMSDYDPTDEYLLMSRAGMDHREILAALTVTPADRFGESSERGRVAEGFAADIVVLESDPASDVRAFGAVHLALRDGLVIYQAERGN